MVRPDRDWPVLLSLCLAVVARDCPPRKTEDCWSEWSPCTVTCKNIEAKTDFAKSWRLWECEDCANVTEPRHKHEFKNCDFKVPYCLWREDIANISTRTVTRVIALALAIFLVATPTVAICCRYTPGHPLVCFCCRRRNRNRWEVPPEVE